MIVTDEKLLRQACEPVKNVREGGEVARLLTATLGRLNKKAVKAAARGKALTVGVGLAAPQIGVLKQVCVLKVGAAPVVLMNPVVVDASTATIPFTEGCLSMPGVQVHTRRHVWVKVKAMNWGEVLTFGPTTPEQWADNTLLLTSVVAQHEIDHLSGILMLDRVPKEPQI